MKIIKTVLPKGSILNSAHFEYVDSYQGEYIDKTDQISAKDIGKAFLMAGPNWIDSFVFKSILGRLLFLVYLQA